MNNRATLRESEFERSVKRVVDSEEQRAEISGFGSTWQGRALIRRYQEQLTKTIGASGAVWVGLKRVPDDDVATVLLFAGVTVCAKDYRQTFRDVALFIGRALGQHGQSALSLGAWGVNILLTLPIFVLEDDDVLALRLTDSLDSFLDGVLDHHIRSHPLLLPCATPPVPWSQIDKGGVPDGHWAQPLLIERHSSIEATVRYAIRYGSMKGVLGAVNSLEAVPFTINKHILGLLQRTPAPHVPDPPAPELPRGKRWRAEQEWREACARSQAWHLDLVTAETLADQDRFYVPLKLDFRGRIYGTPHFNFQREDHVRGLFLFEKGERIGDEGLKYLMAHTAARADGVMWGDDKKPSRRNLEGRIAWTEANLPRLRRIGESILTGAALADDDLPRDGDRYQFAAACVELVQALGAGRDFITCLPLSFDGSCSGLQHLCAMTRAEEGRFVNLTANEEAEDFYSHVAEKVGADRKFVKQPVMTIFYGVTLYGMTQQLIDNGYPRADAKRLAKAIYKAVEGLVPSAVEVRDFLETLVKECAKKNKQLWWLTPLGLPVGNCYYIPEIHNISLKLNGRRRRVKFIVGDTDQVDRRKAVNSVTANFVHSADAAHLQMVALAAQAEGIDMVAVHDSFGCLAPRAKRFNQIVREQFYKLHTDYNLLAAVRESARRNLPRRVVLPPLPKTGSLDLTQVLKSQHAFK
jgi:DNA-directed RNA polymerase